MNSSSRDSTGRCHAPPPARQHVQVGAGEARGAGGADDVFAHVQHPHADDERRRRNAPRRGVAQFAAHAQHALVTHAAACVGAQLAARVSRSRALENRLRSAAQPGARCAPSHRRRPRHFMRSTSALISQLAQNGHDKVSRHCPTARSTSEFSPWPLACSVSPYIVVVASAAWTQRAPSSPSRLSRNAARAASRATTAAARSPVPTRGSRRCPADSARAAAKGRSPPPPPARRRLRRHRLVVRHRCRRRRIVAVVVIAAVVFMTAAAAPPSSPSSPPAVPPARGAPPYE